MTGQKISSANFFDKTNFDHNFRFDQTGFFSSFCFGNFLDSNYVQIN